MLGALVQAGKDDTEIVIGVSPTAKAAGILLDESGQPAANRELSWGRYTFVDDDQGIGMFCFVPKVMTDAKGRFTLPEMIVGEDYSVSIQRDNRFKMAALVRPERPGPIDLGTIQAGRYQPSAQEVAEANSSFHPNALGAGKLAPAFEATTLDGRPLKLEDFRGKYVLLDFWATWCGPCIEEIPQLQAIHDAFGRDERFTILSLSVDEKVDEPRRFQEKRKLPWPQSFLGAGIQGPVPASFGVRAVPAFVLIGPDGKIVAQGMRGEDIKKEVARALGKTP
jgi:thiol-disulfide isomerase/thioredoxin